MDLDIELLDHFERWTERDPTFSATLKGHGLYDTFRFVLRLSPKVHETIATLPDGMVVTGGRFDFSQLQAFSTYLHETVHWWQHIGSTYGLLLSLSYPTQTQGNYVQLKKLNSLVGFQKSIRTLIEKLDGPTNPETPSGVANIIINNHFDLEAFRGLTLSAEHARRIAEDPLFESVGHAFQIAYGNIVHLLGVTADPDFKAIPRPDDWASEVNKLKNTKQEGFYYGSPVTLLPVGAREIFEGQARFAQLQYLHFATGGRFEIGDARDFGMMEGVYGAAFKFFLQFAELDYPDSIDHPTVALFLLICDLAINPGFGFPIPVLSPTTFIGDVDPGRRFLTFSRIIVLKKLDVANAITAYSRQEYEAVSRQLAEASIELPPLAVAEIVSSWPEKSDGIASVMAEYESSVFAPGNLVPRVLLSHFIAFMRDKLATPEVFCWPGAWMAGERVSNHVAELFDRHGALFVDKADGDGIYPRLRRGLDKSRVQTVFDEFYASTLIYDMTRQWITVPGPFTYDYRWLTRNGSDTDIKNYVDRHFEAAYGVHPDTVKLL